MLGTLGLGRATEGEGFLGRHGFGATTGLALFSAAGEGWDRTEGCERGRSGLGGMGGGDGLVEGVSLGLGATGGFFTPAERGRGEHVRQ